jgi:8-oxo-dGTP pyrophosphatase MutT (NUDIX family)
LDGVVFHEWIFRDPFNDDPGSVILPDGGGIPVKILLNFGIGLELSRGKVYLVSNSFICQPKKRGPLEDLTHAGGIVMRVENGTPRYLLVTAKRHEDRWIFPKGHIDPGETPEVTAVREVLEETGVRARILEPVGSVEYRKQDGRVVHCAFFLMEHQRIEGTGEGRKQRWCAFEEALSVLSMEDLRGLLRRCHPVATQLAVRP